MKLPRAIALRTTGNGTDERTGSAGSRSVSSTRFNVFMPLVHRAVAHATRRTPPNVLRDDLIAAGSYGLFDAFRKATDTNDPAFEWYARIRIRGAILDELRAQDWLTRRTRTRLVAAREASGGVSDPTRRPFVIGFDDMPPGHAATDISDDRHPNPLEVIHARIERERVEKAIRQLPERERTIIAMHYFHEVPFKVIANQLSLSEPRISQLHGRALGLLEAILTKAERVNAAYPRAVAARVDVTRLGEPDRFAGSSE